MKRVDFFPANNLETGRLPSWPTFSIGILLILSAIFPPALVTGMNLYLLFLTLMIWSASDISLDRYLLNAVGPFVLILAIGMTRGLGADRYLYLKDVWYISNPAVIISVGYVLYCCRPDVARGLRAFVLAGTLLSLLHLAQFVAHPEVITRNAVEIRLVTSAIGAGATALAFTILCAYFGKWFEGLKLQPWLAWVCLVICILSMLLSFSRTILLIALIGVLASVGAFSRRDGLRIVLIIVAAILLIGALRLIVDVDSTAAGTSFVGKLARSIDEIAVHDYSNSRNISENWRGYETARAMNTYLSGGPFQWLFGHGFGTQVGLGSTTLGTMHEIPILHNGYAFLLVKGGAMAVLLYGIALVYLYRVGRRLATAAEGRFISSQARIQQAIVLSLACSTWFVGGVFNKLYMFSFMLSAGFLLAALTRQYRESV